MSKYEVIWTTFRQVLQFLVISAIIWEFLYMFYLSPTKVAKLLFYSWKWANFFRKPAKLNYMKILKSPGLRPGPIFLNFTKTSRGAESAPPNQNRVKVARKGSYFQILQITIVFLIDPNPICREPLVVGTYLTLIIAYTSDDRKYLKMPSKLFKRP